MLHHYVLWYDISYQITYRIDNWYICIFQSCKIWRPQIGPNKPPNTPFGTMFGTMLLEDLYCRSIFHVAVQLPISKSSAFQRWVHFPGETSTQEGMFCKMGWMLSINPKKWMGMTSFFSLPGFCWIFFCLVVKFWVWSSYPRGWLSSNLAMFMMSVVHEWQLRTCLYWVQPLKVCRDWNSLCSKNTLFIVYDIQSTNNSGGNMDAKKGNHMHSQCIFCVPCSIARGWNYMNIANNYNI